MAKILVTGSNGQLGNELKAICSSYSQHEYFFHDVDTLDISNGEQLNKMFAHVQPHYVINCAAYTAVDKAETEKDTALKLNKTAVALLGKISLQHKAKLIHISTDYVFDGKAHSPYTEMDTTNPISVYGSTKLAGEQALMNESHVMIVRTAWLYSSYGNNFVKTMLRLGKEKDQLSVVCDQIGTPTYAADLAEAILNVISKISAGTSHFVPGVYHYSNEGACSWYDFACEIMRQAHVSCTVLPIETRQYPTPATRPAYSVFNKAKIKSTYNITIPWWQDSLRICIAKLNG